MVHVSVSSRRRTLVVALAALLVAVFTLGSAAQSASASTTNIGGTVTNQASQVLANVEVQAYDSTGAQIPGSDAITNSTGGFVIAVDGNSGDSIYLLYTPASSAYAAQWYGGAVIRTESTPVVLTGGNMLRNAQLAPASTIAGVVTGAGLRPLAGIHVNAFYSSNFDMGDAVTAADGSYTIPSLPAAGYRLEFNDPVSAHGYAIQWYSGKSDEASANVVTPTAGQHVSGINAQLKGTASIAGLVLTTTSVAISGVHVIAEYPDGGSAAAVADTDGSGHYQLTGLPAGSFTMVYSKSGYVSQLYNGHPITASGDTVTLTAGNQTNAGTVHLVAGATISGVVDDEGGSPVTSGSAVLYLASGSGADLSTVVDTASLGADGSYSFDSLATGQYVVGVTTNPTGYDAMTGALLPSSPYISAWFGGAYSYATATAITAANAGTTYGNKNVVLKDPRFADVTDPTSPFFDYIQWMYTSGISTGTAQASGDPLYKPLDSVSRQAMALFLYRLSGVTFVPPGVPTFQDVPTSSSFYTAIEWMAANNISTGTPVAGQKPLYKPSDAVSRQAMALFLARYAGADISTPPTTQVFADVPIGASSAAAINWMYTNGISTGTAQPSGLPLYKPADPVSRQSMAAFLYRVAHLP